MLAKSISVESILSRYQWYYQRKRDGDGDGFENLLKTKFKAIAARLMNNNNNKKKRCNQNYPVIYNSPRYINWPGFNGTKLIY
ncbi:hypothetical protein DERP_011488 [Dermatophagoides pteronyssinus]|uniref:Uncharacterized protein n=1 Tax=Dermatophagoides pteronyssinus TaxID=6956 RepID=A0ABQ8JC27_DERPT|nr:hypothetical protein DERP_011488 [Dermatophagoides pteronyssinus]